MSIRSAQTKLNQLSSHRGYCLPLSLDAVMHKSDLPEEYFEMFAQPYLSGEDIDGTPLYESLISDFFGVTPEKDNNKAAIAGYNAFGASEQPWCPDAEYEYDLESYVNLKHPLTNKNVRLHRLLKQTALLGCNVIFNTPGRDGGSHVAGLELIDPQSALYVIRNTSDRLYPHKGRIYTVAQLSGIAGARDGYTDKYAPLPEFSRPHYAQGATSWELTIFPPDPAA